MVLARDPWKKQAFVPSSHEMMIICIRNFLFNEATDGTSILPSRFTYMYNSLAVVHVLVLPPLLLLPAQPSAAKDSTCRRRQLLHGGINQSWLAAATMAPALCFIVLLLFTITWTPQRAAAAGRDAVGALLAEGSFAVTAVLAVPRTGEQKMDGPARIVDKGVRLSINSY